MLQNRVSDFFPHYQTNLWGPISLFYLEFKVEISLILFS